MLKYAPIVILLTATAPVAAQGQAVPGTAAAAPAKASPLDRIICRTEESLGSRLSRKKVCMTAREWKDQADDSRDATERLQQLSQNPKSGA
jgi:hypothetical protein